MTLKKTLAAAARGGSGASGGSHFAGKSNSPAAVAGGSGVSGGSLCAKESNHPAPVELEADLDERAVNDQAIQALAAAGGLYAFAGGLVTVAPDPGHPDRLAIRRLPPAAIRERLAECVRFYNEALNDRSGRMERRYVRVPRWSSEAIAARGNWPGIPPLRGIVRSPVLQPDGNILQQPGFDESSGLFLDFRDTDFPAIPPKPSRQEAAAAVGAFKELLVDFPWRSDTDFAGWLAALLTPLARPAHSGATGPLFLFDANCRGAGKSLLADLLSLIACGQDAVRMIAPSSDDELRKRIGGLVLSGEPLALIDNIGGKFGGPAIDSALTGTVWKDRRLGAQDMLEADLRVVWTATGNNVALRADTARRTCLIRLETAAEHPEDRSGFRVADIRGFVRQHRGRLLAAALTILRGYFAAGRPDQGLRPWGSFESWSGIVRSAVVWAGLPDPGGNRDELRESADSDSAALRAFLAALEDIDPERHGMKAAELLKIADGFDGGYSTEQRSDLKAAIEALCEAAGGKVSQRSLGNRLSHFRGRVVGGSSLDFRMRSGHRYWLVSTAASSTDDLTARRKQSHQSPVSHQTEATVDVDWLEESHL
jgi:hypothetical protein